GDDPAELYQHCFVSRGHNFGRRHADGTPVLSTEAVAAPRSFPMVLHLRRARSFHPHLTISHAFGSVPGTRPSPGTPASARWARVRAGTSPGGVNSFLNEP